MSVRFLVLVLITTLGLFSCDKKDSDHVQTTGIANKRATKSDSPYTKGTCFDKVISPYVYQIAQIEGGKIFYFAMGKASKEVMNSTIEELFKGENPFHIIDCP